MLAFDRSGSGPPLLLMHGTTSSRRVWKPFLAELERDHDVLSVDLPGHGDSPQSSFSPPEWAKDVADLLDSQGLDKVAVIGHSAGGWTALELAKAGRASAVVTLAPAGLWRKHSPILTDVVLNTNWYMGRLARGLAPIALRSRLLRSIVLRNVSARPGDIPAEVAIDSARTAAGTDGFPRHFSETRRLRFTGGQEIGVPVKVIWGDKDRIARKGKSDNLDELPPQTEVETWAGCGHMLMWDAPDQVLATSRWYALSLSAET